MKLSITLSLLPSSPQRPFVLGPDVDAGFRLAAELGYDAVEIFPPSLEALAEADLSGCIAKYGIPVSTIGTGGGAVSLGLTLVDPDPAIRQRAEAYIEGIVQAASELDAAAIIGSMQGRANGRPAENVRELLAASLVRLAERARQLGQPLIFEPLNRYESDLANTLDEAAGLCELAAVENLVLLADLFHMNIEEADIDGSLQKHANAIGHVHFVDSNRRAGGWGHTDLESALRVLHAVGFSGYFAVEAFPLPDAHACARQAVAHFQSLLKKIGR